MKTRISKTRQVIIALALAAIASTYLNSCSSENKESVEQTESIKVLESKLQSRDSVFNQLLTMMNQIEEQVDVITKRENIIANSNKEDGEMSEETILKELQLIDQLVQNSNETIAALNGELRKNDLQLSSFQKRVDKLNAQLNTKEQTISDLQAKIANKNNQLQTLAVKFDSIQIMAVSQKKKINEQGQEIELLNSINDDLNKVSYVVGSYKDLKEKGIVSKEGGFLWLGKTVDFNESVEQDVFNQTDVRKLRRLPIEASKLELVTEHPEDSYTIVEDEIEEDVKYLEILDPDKFWKVSKYLVVSTKS